MKEPVPATEPIVVECELPQPPALVWRALTEKELLAAWLLPNDLQAEVGARFTFEPAERRAASQRESERSDCIDCEVLQVEPNRTLSWRQTEPGDAASGWQPVTSVVTIQLTANTTGGTHLRLVHDEFATAASATTAASGTTAAAAGAGAARVIPLQRRRPAGGVASLLTGPDIVCQLRRAA